MSTYNKICEKPMSLIAQKFSQQNSMNYEQMKCKAQKKQQIHISRDTRELAVSKNSLHLETKDKK
jgi:hypothetical protein